MRMRQRGGAHQPVAVFLGQDAGRGDAGSIPSPPTIARAGQRHSGTRPCGVRLPSISASPDRAQLRTNRAIARVIASMVAAKMLIRSISAGSTTPSAERSCA